MPVTGYTAMDDANAKKIHARVVLYADAHAARSRGASAAEWESAVLDTLYDSVQAVSQRELDAIMAIVWQRWR